MAFIATHVVTIGDERIPVHAEEGHDGGTVLYTSGEWAQSARADWELTPEGELQFQGGSLHGASIERLEVQS